MILAAMLISGFSYCQINYTKNWAFSFNQSISFLSGNPVTGSGTLLAGDGEGCASISDRNTGQLLFYTDGVTVYTRNNLVMQNGNGLFGHTSSSQGAIIIPKPGSNTQYYLFTVPEVSQISNSVLAYSIIDMTLNNGFGAVTNIKNVVLNTTASEKIAAVKHCNGIDYWVITPNQFSNAFNAYKVTSAGISAAVVSLAGSNNTYPRTPGQLKISPNGKKIAKASYYNNNNSSGALAELFDFDNSLGIVSNPMDVTVPGFTNFYGTEFSPDSKQVYFNATKDPYTKTWLFQFDLNINDLAAINNSVLQITDNISRYRLAGLQLAPDNKIYVADFPYVSTIDTPNLRGNLCHYTSSVIPMQPPWYMGIDFPSFVSSFFNPTDSINTNIILNIPDLIKCNSDTITITAPANYSNYTWLPNYNINTNNGANVNIWPAVDTFYILTALTSDGCHLVLDTINVNVFSSESIDLGSDTSICENDVLNLNAGEGFINYLWNNGSGSQHLLVNSAGIYNVIATDMHGCSSYDSIELINIIPRPYVNLGTELTLCKGEHFTLDANTFGAAYLWNDHSTNSTLTIAEPGIHWVNVTLNGCSAIDTIMISYKDCGCLPIIPNAITPNGDGINDYWVITNIACLKQLNVSVYNRYGSLVYQKDNYKNDWQGTYRLQSLPDGTYYYILNATDNNHLQRIIKGSLTIFR